MDTKILMKLKKKEIKDYFDDKELFKHVDESVTCYSDEVGYCNNCIEHCENKSFYYSSNNNYFKMMS